MVFKTSLINLSLQEGERLAEERGISVARLQLGALRFAREEHTLHRVGRLSSRELSVALSQRAGRVQPLQKKRKESEEHIKGRIPKEDVSRIRHRIRVNRR